MSYVRISMIDPPPPLSLLTFPGSTFRPETIDYLWNPVTPLDVAIMPYILVYLIHNAAN